MSLFRKSVVVFLLVACAFLFFSCSTSEATSVPFSASGKAYPLRALNQAAQTGVLTGTDKASYLYYAFPADEELAALQAGTLPLSLDLTFYAEEDASVTVAFLYDADFNDGALTKGTLTKRPTVTSSVPAGKKVELLFALPPDAAGTVRGFLVQSASAVALSSAALAQTSFGLVAGEMWVRAGFGPEGGTWKDSGTVPESWNFSQLYEYGGCPLDRYIVIHFRNNPADAGTNGHPAYVGFQAGSRKFSFRRTKDAEQVEYVQTSFFDNEGAFFEITSNKEMVSGVEYVFRPRGEYDPVLTDPGMIIDWPASKWKQEAYELFAWSHDPTILFFDTRDYAVQDDLFRRLAFFAEKKGYRGTLVSDSELAGQHGFNAHDYRPETLAAFFDKAQKENFPLNALELELRSILVANGIILETQDGFAAGKGAVISISQESARYLRSQLLAHEAFHGLYFTTEAFRQAVDVVRNEMDEKSLDFIYSFFETQPQLGYERNDEYLMKNEFMAYVLQVGTGGIQSYFAENLACRGSVMKAIPDLAEYVRLTNAAGILEAAQRLDDFVYETWSMNAGRPWLVTMD